MIGVFHYPVSDHIVRKSGLIDLVQARLGKEIFNLVMSSAQLYTYISVGETVVHLRPAITATILSA